MMSAGKCFNRGTISLTLCSIKKWPPTRPDIIICLADNVHGYRLFHERKNMANDDDTHNIHCVLNTLKPKQPEKYLADNIFHFNFFHENCYIFIQISLEVVSKSLINNMPVLVEITAYWQQTTISTNGGQVQWRMYTSPYLNESWHFLLGIYKFTCHNTSLVWGVWL